MWMVEHLFAYGWDDADWHDGDEPWRFATRAEAEAEIRDFVRDMRAAGMKGYRVRDYRVVRTS